MRTTVPPRPFKFYLLRYCPGVSFSSPHGRFHCRRASRTSSHYFGIRLVKRTKHDNTVWLNFLSTFNGRSFFYHDIWKTPSFIELYTDAAGSKNYGAILDQHWFFGPFPDTWQSFNITFLELVPIALAVRLWSRHISNRWSIVFDTNNAALVSIINQQTSKHKLVIILIRDRG